MSVDIGRKAASGHGDARKGSPMGVWQHPSAELRSNYAIGNLAPGAALAVAAHLELCESCRSASGRTERVQRLRRTAGRASAQEAAAEPKALAAELPPSLEKLPVGRWRRIRSGVRAAPLKGAAGLGESVHLLKIAPTARAPLPTAAEFVLVLDGVLHQDAMTYKVGDFLELGALRGGKPQAGARIGCLCLVVGDETLYRRPFLDWIQRLRGA
jgi:anti-sigma factor ChrR (cupin superfamily)